MDSALFDAARDVLDRNWTGSSTVPAASLYPHPWSWETSGLIQPPLHARAALEVYQQAQDRPQALALLERVYPRLVAWHR